MGLSTAVDVRALLGGAHAAGVDYVVTGSVAALAYGVPTEPRDLDIAPALDPSNLARIAELLREWGAKPHFDPDWEQVTEEDCERWTPDPATAENLDHLFETRHGLFDVVPQRSGVFEELAPRALVASLDGAPVRVAHPCDLIPHLRLHKPKHQSREPYLDDLCDRARIGELPVPRFETEASR
jgi:hypothetical protein